jgi:LuxR family maltose regulon positive regulatory protein
LKALDVEADDRQPAKGAPSQVLVEPLSKRELQVLRLMAAGLSSLEIAEELVIAVSTVRSHIKNIYGKLNVHSRYEAVERARQLQLF